MFRLLFDQVVINKFTTVAFMVEIYPSEREPQECLSNEGRDLLEDEWCNRLAKSAGLGRQWSEKQGKATFEDKQRMVVVACDRFRDFRSNLCSCRFLKDKNARLKKMNSILRAKLDKLTAEY